MKFSIILFNVAKLFTVYIFDKRYSQQLTYQFAWNETKNNAMNQMNEREKKILNTKVLLNLNDFKCVCTRVLDLFLNFNWSDGKKFFSWYFFGSWALIYVLIKLLYFLKIN